MTKEAWVDKNHVRVTSDDGSKSYLYKSDGWTRNCVEVADHHSDGTTDAYEPDTSIVGGLFHGGKGKHK